MKTNPFAAPRGLVACVLILPALILRAADSLPAVAHPTVNQPVTVTDQATNWIMDNGIVKLTVSKSNGKLLSYDYHGLNIAGPRSEGWERYPGGAITKSVTIDPAQNGGERGEVSVKGVGSPMDMEIRYTLQRGVSGFYTYAEYSHQASYPTSGYGENRFILQMNPTFNWLTTDADRNMLMISNSDQRGGVVIHAKEQSILSTGLYKNSVEHKYSYCGVMYRLPAYGWSSVKDHVGVYFINPSTEYIGGGAEKLDLVCHMGATLLDYWTSGHYGGGANNSVPAGEIWKHVVGPIFVYCNYLPDPKVPSPADLDTLNATAGNPTVPPAWHDNATALWLDAVARSKVEKTLWPYDWVNGIDYPHKEGRATVTGQLVLDDPQAATKKLPHLTIGLAHPEYTGTGGAFAQRSGNGNRVTWAHDGNYYQFWADGNEDGTFAIPNVRPGTYTLHAFADGVLGEYTNSNITVVAGQPLNLGKLDWKPVRYGKQIWDIGYPDRIADKFFKGDGSNYWLWGWPVRYPLLFPNDITYTIGKSDYHKDWFFEEVPHGESTAWLNPEAKDPANQRFGWVHAGTPGEDMWRTIGHGRATTWTIKFNMDKTPQGKAYFRLALAGSDGNGGLIVAVNGKPAGTIKTISTNALRYNTDRGVWREYTLDFDASLMHSGENEMTLTVPAGDLTSGVVYDYLRLELAEN